MKTICDLFLTAVAIATFAAFFDAIFRCVFGI